MGGQLAKRAYQATYGQGFTPNERHVLVFMAITALDTDDQPRYFGSREMTAMALDRLVPDAPAPDAPDAAEIERVRANSFEAVRIAISGLVRKGTITRVKHGRAGQRAEFALNLGGLRFVDTNALTRERIRGGITPGLEEPADAWISRSGAGSPRPTRGGITPGLEEPAESWSPEPGAGSARPSDPGPARPTRGGITPELGAGSPRPQGTTEEPRQEQLQEPEPQPPALRVTTDFGAPHDDERQPGGEPEPGRTSAAPKAVRSHPATAAAEQNRRPAGRPNFAPLNQHGECTKHPNYPGPACDACVRDAAEAA